MLAGEVNVLRHLLVEVLPAVVLAVGALLGFVLRQPLVAADAQHRAFGVFGLFRFQVERIDYAMAIPNGKLLGVLLAGCGYPHRTAIRPDAELAVVVAFPIAGAAGASNTFTITVTIDDSGNLGSNQVVVLAELINAEATGITFA